MDRKKLVLIGGGGHCKVVISQLRRLDEFEIVGITDNHKHEETVIAGSTVIGKDEKLKELYEKGVHYALITIGSVKDNTKRHKLFNIAKEIGYKIPIVISPFAVVDATVKIDEGTVVMPHCTINPDVHIGKNCIINTGAIIEHDCKIGDHVHIAPGVHISGGVEIGDMSFIGIGSTVIQGIKIGKNVTIGAGAVIVNDIPDNVIAVGNPGRVINKKEI